MMRNRYQNPSAFFRRLIHLSQYVFVFFDVLEYIESSDYIKLFSKRNSSRVHLEQLDPRQALSSERQTRGKNLTAAKREFR